MKKITLVLFLGILLNQNLFALQENTKANILILGGTAIFTSGVIITSNSVERERTYDPYYGDLTEKDKYNPGKGLLGLGLVIIGTVLFCRGEFLKDYPISITSDSKNEVFVNISTKI